LFETRERSLVFFGVGEEEEKETKKRFWQALFFLERGWKDSDEARKKEFKKKEC
jgi:hypothetical protein